MKAPVAVALIAFGVLLICVPPLSDYMTTSQMLVAQQTIASSKGNMPGISLPSMSQEYRFCCFLLGAIMITIAIARSWGPQKAS